MEQLKFLFQSFTLLFGFSSVVVIFVFFIVSKKRSALHFSFFMYGLFLMLLNDWYYSVTLFFPDTNQELGFLLLRITGFPSLILLVWGIFHFTYKIINRKIGLPVKIAILIITTASQIVSYLYVLTFQYVYIVGIAYLAILIIINYKNIGDKYVKRVLKQFLILSIIHMPAFIFYFIDIPFIVVTVFHNIYLLIISIGVIAFGIKYFMRKPFIVDNKPTEDYIKTYNITDRESEIVELLICGDSTKDIAEKLFISPKTVTNHITNIYVKTGVKSRIQLLNLLNNNSIS